MEAEEEAEEAEEEDACANKTARSVIVLMSFRWANFVSCAACLLVSLVAENNYGRGR